MKTNYISILLAMTLAGCADDTLVQENPENPDEIKVTATITPLSRSASYYTPSNLPQTFRLFSTVASSQIKYINDVSYTKATSSNSYSTADGSKHLWPNSGALDFYAVAGTSATCNLMGDEKEDPTGSSGNLNNPIVTDAITIAENASTQDDILYAATTGKSLSDNLVSLSFKHGLGAYKFKVRVTNQMLYVVVKSITLKGIINKGKFVVHKSGESDWYVDTWKRNNDGTVVGSDIDESVFTGDETIYSAITDGTAIQYHYVADQASYHIENANKDNEYAYTFGASDSFTGTTTTNEGIMFLMPQPGVYHYGKDGSIITNDDKNIYKQYGLIETDVIEGAYVNGKTNSKIVIDCEIYTIADAKTHKHATSDLAIFRGKLAIPIDFETAPCVAGTLYTTCINFGDLSGIGIPTISYDISTSTFDDGSNATIYIHKTVDNSEVDMGFGTGDWEEG